jgi:hypothetical protein
MVKNLVTRYKFSVMAGVTAAAITKACLSSLAGAVDGKRIDVNSAAAVNYLNKQLKPVPKIGVDALYESAVKCCGEAKNYSGKYLRMVFGIGSVRARRIVETMKLNGVIPKDAGEKMKPGEKRPINITVPHERGHIIAKQKKKYLEGDVPGLFEIPKNIEDFADMSIRDLVAKFGTDIRFCDWLQATKLIEGINEKRLKNAATKGDLVSRKLVKDSVIIPVDSCHRRLLSDGARSLSIRVPAMHDAGEDSKKIEKYIHDQLTSFIRPMKTKIARALRNIEIKEEYNGTDNCKDTGKP